MPSPDKPREDSLPGIDNILNLLDGLKVIMNDVQSRIDRSRCQILAVLSRQEYRAIVDEEGEDVIPPEDIVNIVMVERDGKVDVTEKKLAALRENLAGLSFCGLCPSWNAYSRWDGDRRRRFRNTVFYKNSEWFRRVGESLGAVWVEMDIRGKKIFIIGSEYDSAAPPPDMTLESREIEHGKMPIGSIPPAGSPG